MLSDKWRRDGFRRAPTTIADSDERSTYGQENHLEHAGASEPHETTYKSSVNAVDNDGEEKTHLTCLFFTQGCADGRRVDKHSTWTVEDQATETDGLLWDL